MAWAGLRKASAILKWTESSILYDGAEGNGLVKLARRRAGEKRVRAEKGRETEAKLTVYRFIEADTAGART